MGCTSRKFSLEENIKYTNIQIINPLTEQEVILDNEKSQILAKQLEESDFKRKRYKKKETGLYEVRLLKGTSEVGSFQIIDEHSIVYLDKLYKSDEGINLESINSLMEQECITKEAMAQKTIEEKVFKVEHSNARICVYVSKETEEDEKIEYMTIESEGQQLQYKDFEAYFDKLIWIEEETRAILAYHNNQGKNFMIIDLPSCQVIYKGDLDYESMRQAFEVQGEVLSNKEKVPQEFNLVYNDVSNDGKKIMIEYEVIEETGITDTGSFWYELETGKVSGIIKTIICS